RAGIFSADGTMLAHTMEPIEMWRPHPDFAEQSSEDIWSAICKVVKECLALSSVPKERVAGISFDATCSLVVLDQKMKPLAVNAERDHDRNIIVWMDHRALAETEEINSGKHDVLKFVGGRVSPEMEMPKLKWIKKNLPETWAQAGKFFDLADFLCWRSTGIDVRSVCTVGCKWNYLSHEGEVGRWDTKYVKKIGLGDLFSEGKVVDDVQPMGSAQGYLTRLAAKELGLTTDCAVGVGIIDAHAGGLGLLGNVWAGSKRRKLGDLENALALIGGTSNCHMAVSREPRFIPGVWGPYFSAMVPGMWLAEGGQSSAGSAIDHVIQSHANYSTLVIAAKRQKKTIYEVLNCEVARIKSETKLGPEITRDVHVLPDFIGNRSPLADPYVRGMIDGISLDQSLESHALVYYATVQAVAYGTRMIVEAMNRAGFEITTLYVTGGGSKNPLWLQEHADATGCKIVLAKEPEAVLLGTAILAATACGLYGDIYAAMQGMSSVGETVKPSKSTFKFHKRKYRAFLGLYLEHERRRQWMRKI
ncbi:MAG: FGGY-family carbohydrate kinase, partial [Chthonomonadales bacterium]